MSEPDAKYALLHALEALHLARTDNDRLRAAITTAVEELRALRLPRMVADDLAAAVGGDDG